MAEYASNGKANAGLATGIIGTVLGALSGGAGLLGNMANNNGRAYETTYATMHDVDDAKVLAEKDSEIAQLKAQQTVDAKIVDTYKTLANMINTLKDEETRKWTDQMVVNAQLTSAVNVNTNNLIALTAKVDGFTKTVIPTSSVCNTNNCGCGNM